MIYYVLTAFFQILNTTSKMFLFKLSLLLQFFYENNNFLKYAMGNECTKNVSYLMLQIEHSFVLWLLGLKNMPLYFSSLKLFFINFQGNQRQKGYNWWSPRLSHWKWCHSSFLLSNSWLTIPRLLQMKHEVSLQIFKFRC